uniref:Uncharacterized protein n=1 Tax=Ralstonia syzygii R24 TaxID=907261 RepID=G3A8A2_9RALS|nr:hypothetical protein RALSY_40858 [Ralstonia syzygii R24]
MRRRSVALDLRLTGAARVAPLSKGLGKSSRASQNHDRTFSNRTPPSDGFRQHVDQIDAVFSGQMPCSATSNVAVSVQLLR